MRILPFIILLFTTMGAFAQYGAEDLGRSQNIEPYRSYVLPASSKEEAASDKIAAMRYAIPVVGWEESKSGAEVTFDATFESPFSWIGRQAIVSIEAASAPYTLFVDGREVGRCNNASMPAQFNVTRFLKQEAESSVTIVMKRDEQLSELEAWDDNYEMTLGRVVMLSQPTMYIRDVDVATTNMSGMLNTSIAIVVKSTALNKRTSRINYELLTPNGSVAKKGYGDVSLEMRGEDTLYVFAAIPDSLAWSEDRANRYRLNLSTQYRGRHLEYYSFEIGMRSVEQGDGGELLINGKPQALKAVEVDSSIGIDKLEGLKQQGYNTLKVAAGDHNMSIYNYADSVGMYVIATAPINSSKSGDNIFVGGNPTNDPARVGEYIERVDAIYNLTKLHPSVVAYAIADRSLNGINLYESYLYLKAREKARPIIYLDNAGEWNSDSLRVEIDRE